MNKVANVIVTKSPEIASSLSSTNNAACAHVNEAPDVKSNAVFNNGIPQALIVAIPTGGHTPPISGTGFKLEWKNAQKKAKNNIISETMNNTNPKRSPF